ncbi:MAG: glycosyltransferase family 4 protein [Verrucomicrobiota bacterium]|nr:glycosyltransferase family 4 protein [Verrucomicrobiota bacterium]MDE3067376.1 glycosyltransferase family 4 protein [Verrucomicrobiota bacterium]
MKRIAYVSADLGVPIFGQKGCSIHAQEVLRALIGRGVRVELFTANADGEPPAGLETIAVHPLPRPPKADRAAREQAALAANETLCAKLMDSGPFSFVYERYSLWSYAAMEYARTARVPGLLEVNAPLIEEQAEYRVLVDRAAAEQAARRAFGAATHLLAVSEEVAAYLDRFPEARKKIHVAPNGVRPERFPENIRPALPTARGVFTVCFVGTLKAWHGVSTLVDAFARLHARDPLTRLLIVGHGPEREKITAEVTACGLQAAVHFTGAVAPESVPAWLASSDVAVAPYPRLANFYFSPLKVYEYMAAARAVVASRLGQLGNLIESGVNGLLVPPGDAAALAAALDQLRTDPGLRRRLGQAARATVLRDHTWDAVVRCILGLAGLEPAKPRR